MSNNEYTKTLPDYIEILRRRRQLALAPAAVLLLLAIVAAVTLPSRYLSSGRILLEDPTVSGTLGDMSIAGFASQHIQLVSERVLGQENILRIVRKYGVYGSDEELAETPPSLVAAQFRNDVRLDFESTNIIDPRSPPREVVIAFTLSFIHFDPRTAQQVAEELVNLFLQENINRRQTRASEVSVFLEEQVADAQSVLLEAEAQLASFKSENEGALPTQYNYNQSIIDRVEQQLLEANLRTQQLEQRTIELTSQLSTLDPNTAVAGSDGSNLVSDRERLRQLMSEYRRKAAIYNDGHPDLTRLEREMRALSSDVGDVDTAAVLRSELERERGVLAELEQTYGAEHPDVKRSRATVARMEDALGEMDVTSLGDAASPDNPAYVLVDTQLRTVGAELRSLQQRKIELNEKLEFHQALLRQTPEVEREYEALMRRYENAELNYSELQAQLMDARVAANVETELSQKRFQLIEAPSVPTAPISPNREAIVVLGTILGLGIGLFLVFAAEALDNSLRGEKAVAAVTGTPPLITVPYLDASASPVSASSGRLIDNKLYTLVLGAVLLIVGYALLEEPISRLIEFIF